MDNHVYNLITALSQKAESSWVMDAYEEDSKACLRCSELWKKLKEADEKYVLEMKQILIAHVKDGIIK